MDVLFEYRGSKTELTVGERDSLKEVVSAELRRIGKARAQVLTTRDTLPPPGGRAGPEVYILQKWSDVWGCFVDVRNHNEVSNGDRLAVIARPKPASKVLYWVPRGTVSVVMCVLLANTCFVVLLVLLLWI